MQVFSKVSIEAKKLIDGQAGDKKRNCKTGGIKRREHETAAPTATRGSETDDAAKYRADARRPAGGESHAEGRGAEQAARFIGELRKIW